jgi:hypothetical protein
VVVGIYKIDLAVQLLGYPVEQPIHALAMSRERGISRLDESEYNVLQ